MLNVLTSNSARKNLSGTYATITMIGFEAKRKKPGVIPSFIPI